MKWEIDIPNFIGGFAPAYYLSTYPSYGNRNMAGDMQNVDLTNPAYITQGPGLVNLTNGIEAGVVSTLIRGILDRAQANDLSFAVGGDKLYEISSTTVTNNAADPVLPHSINGTGTVVAEDVEYFKGEIYYSHYDDNAGDVGKYDLTRDADADFDDDWATAVKSASITRGGPLPLEVGADKLFLGHGHYVADYDGTTWDDDALDLPTNAEVQDIKWNLNRLWISANEPDLAGDNKVNGSVYIWDGESPSWEDVISFKGRLGALYVKNGIVYVFYQDITSTGGYKLGYVNGVQIRELASFKGSLPQYYQVTEYKNFIIWVSGGKIYGYGAADKSLPGILFQLADGGHSTVGGLAAPFGTPIVASYDGSTAYRLAKFSGYDTACYWKSLLFDVNTLAGKSMIDEVLINFEQLATGARVDIILRDNQGTALDTKTISYTDNGAVTSKTLHPKTACENFRLELDWSNGSTTNPVSIKNIKISGHTI